MQNVSILEIDFFSEQLCLLKSNPDGQSTFLCPDCFRMECTVGLRPLMLIIGYRWLCKSHHWRNRAIHRTTELPIARVRHSFSRAANISGGAASNAVLQPVQNDMQSRLMRNSLILGELQVNSVSITDKHSLCPECCRWRTTSVSSSASGRRFYCCLLAV